MLSIGLIGDGYWAQIVKKEIFNNKNFNLKSVFSRSNFNLDQNYNYKKYLNLDEMIRQERLDCYYVAANPKVNEIVYNLLKKNKTPVIFEKPLSYNSIQCDKIIQSAKNNHCIFTNLPNIYSESFSYLDTFFKKNSKNIERIHIIEGGMGPINKDIDPLMDWGIHPISLILKLFNKDALDIFKSKKIKYSRYHKVFKIIFLNDQTEIKIITGNGFKKKIKKVKIFLKNNDILECDFILHQIFLNKINVFISKKTPLSVLLDNFFLNINQGLNNNELENLIHSRNSIKIIEKFV